MISAGVVNNNGSAMPFARGKSGNPQGRKPGVRNRRTLTIEAMFAGELEAVGRKAIELALSGDIDAIKLVLDRVAPAPLRRDRVVRFKLPDFGPSPDPGLIAIAILSAAASGKVTPNEASCLADLIGFRPSPAPIDRSETEYELHVGLSMPALRHHPVGPAEVEAMQRELAGEVVKPDVEAPEPEPIKAPAGPPVAAPNSHLRRRE